MRGPILLLGLVAGLALTACDSVMTTSGPPPAGTSVGTSVSPAQQQAREIGGANSPNASAGTPAYTGTDGARPTFDRSGTASPGVGGATTQGPVGTTRTRPN
jgi:hypothetical protein